MFLLVSKVRPNEYQTLQCNPANYDLSLKIKELEIVYWSASMDHCGFLYNLVQVYWSDEESQGTHSHLQGCHCRHKF